MNTFVYSRAERAILIALGAIGFLVVNGIFLYSVYLQPALIIESLKNPISAVFIIEALLLVVVLGHFLKRWKLTQISLGMFIFLSLIGSLAFSLPVALLYSPRS